MVMSKYILQTHNLSKSFGRTEVLHGIEMFVEQGKVYGLIGQNGAGKTTLLRLISGLMKPTKGSVNLQMGKSYIGYMPQSCRFDDNSTVLDTICFFARLRNADVKESALLGEKLKLEMNKKVRHLSPGQQKKLQLVIAMTGEPELFILDEPTAGLDPNATFEMKNIIRNIHKQGKSIIISSHILQDMNEVCTNIGIMQSGQLTYYNEIECCYIFRISAISKEIFAMLSNNFHISVDEFRTTLTAEICREQVPQLISALCLQGISIFEVTTSNIKDIVNEQLCLEEVQK